MRLSPRPGLASRRSSRGRDDRLRTLSPRHRPMTRIASLPLYVDDYEAATAHLSLEEDGAYTRLLRLCWRQSGCSVPDDPAWLTRHLRVSEEQFNRVIEPVIAEFFTRRRGRIFQKRLVSEFVYVKAVLEKRKEAGKKGVAAKALKAQETSASKRTTTRAPIRTTKANGLLKHPSPSPSPSPLSKNTPSNEGVVVADANDTPDLLEIPGNLRRANGTEHQPVQKAFDNYNIAAAEYGLPLAEKLTEDRKRHLRARLKEHGLEGWNRALVAVEGQPFLTGANDRAWRATLDFFLQPSSLNKVLEGSYGEE